MVTQPVQIGFGEKKNPVQAAAGHAKKANTTAKKKYVEFKDFADGAVSLGDVLTVGMFEEGEFVDIVGTTKGKGFQGVVRRHGFCGRRDKVPTVSTTVSALPVRSVPVQIPHAYSKERAWVVVWGLIA